MARVTGFKCDGPKCSSISENGHLPIGWVRVIPVVDSEKVREGENELHLCSNNCLVRLAKERFSAAVEAGQEKGSPLRGRKKSG